MRKSFVSSVDSSNMYDSHVYDSRFLRKSHRKLQFDPSAYVTNDISYEDVIDIKEVFDVYDSTGAGVLLPGDVRLFLQQHGYNANMKTVYHIIAEFDEEQTGGMDFNDFITAMKCRPQLNETRKEIYEIFRKYDKADKGYFNFQDLKNVNEYLKESVDEDTLRDMFNNADIKRTGKVNFDDFYSLMIKNI